MLDIVVRKRHIRRHLWVSLLALAAGCGPREAAKPGVTVAAAANLTDVFGRLGPRFEAATGITPVFSFASTAQLARQIENSAPFDVFAAADSQHVEQLEREGLLLAGSRAVYARGVLALWIPPGSPAGAARLKDLVSAQVRVIAIAKPELAPYGQAAVDSLTRLGLWEQVRPKVVFAENINMAKQYGAARNVDAVFTAYSLVLHEAGTVLRVEETLHRPIDQELGVVAKSEHPDAARKFAAFLLAPEGLEVLSGFGYLPPGK
jgi:molybdate transport system substrate-binding protein